MIKLNDKYYTPFYIKKSNISLLEKTRDEHGGHFTIVHLLDGSDRLAKETPEEILAIPDIEETEKVIDWEQRRYEIAKEVMAAIYTRPNVNGTLLNISMIVNAADALIDVLKKGGEK